MSANPYDRLADPKECCKQALENLDHEWIIFQGTSIPYCRQCFQDVCSQAIGDNRCVESGDFYVMIDTEYCVECRRYLRKGATVNPCTKCGQPQNQKVA